MKKYFQNVMRNTWKNRGSYIGAILIVALGILVYVAMDDFLFNLNRTVQNYYTDTEFADVFATVKGIPQEELAKLESIEGIQTAFGRMAADVRIDNDSSNEIVVVHLLGYSADDSLNRLYFTDRVAGISPDSLYLGKNMSKELSFHPGDQIRLVINGKSTRFNYVSTVSEPEYLDVAPEGSDDTADYSHYDIGAIDEATFEKLTGKSGSVTELGFRLQKGYTFENVQAELEEMLGPYGLENLCRRKDQSSYYSIQVETNQNRAAGMVLPVIFILCSMFMVYIILKKLIDKDRILIGTMKAMGAYNGELLSIYLVQAAVIGLSGSVLGIVAAWPFGSYLFLDDVDSYNLPETPYISPVSSKILVVIAAVLVCLVTVYLGVRDVVKINPADSMRSAEPRVKGKFSVPAGLRKIMNLRQVIGLRSIFRNPSRSMVTIIAIAVSYGMMASFIAFSGVLKEKFVGIYSTVKTFDYSVSLNGPDTDDRILDSFSGFSYIDGIETAGNYSVTLRAGNHSRYGSLAALKENSAMMHPYDQTGREHPVPENGMLLEKNTAERLHASAGDLVEVEIPELSDVPVRVPVTDILDDKFGNGTSCYLNIGYLQSLYHTEAVSNRIYINMKPSQLEDLKKILKNAENVSSLIAKDKLRRDSGDSMKFMTAMMNLFCIFSIFMDVIMITNITGISVRERKNEFGTLMILGMTQREVNEIIEFEHGIDFLIGILLGFPMGRLCEIILDTSISYDTYTLRMKIPPSAYALSFCISLVVMAMSTAFVIRDVKKIELTDILKERE